MTMAACWFSIQKQIKIIIILFKIICEEESESLAPLINNEAFRVGVFH